MNQENTGGNRPVDDELKALKRHVLSLASIVESALADAIVALIESDSEAAQEARLEDYKAHQGWLQADTLCVDLLSTGQLNLEQVNFVSATMKIALHLKFMADEAIRISRHMRACPTGNMPPGPSQDILPGMAEMAQSMFSDSIDAFVNRDGTEAQSQHLVFRELSSQKQALDRSVSELGADGKLDAAVGTALVLVGRALESIGEHALEIASCVSHLYAPEENHTPMGGEAE